MNTYLALTIGPIYKTLSQAQRTREFWGGSYLFSWIMREIIVGLIDEKRTMEPKDILMPYRDKHDNLKKGTGLYHDRMIAKIKSENKEKALDDFKSTADKVLCEIVKHSGVPLNVLQSYFRLNVVVFDLEEGENIVETATNYLDSLELQTPIFHNASLIDWHTAIDDLNGSLLYMDAFPIGGDFNFVFDSIPEIASRGLKNDNTKEHYDSFVKEYITNKLIEEKREKKRLNKKEIEKIQDTFLEKLSKDKCFKDDFRNYHKYIAIVHADGDNLGQTINTIGSFLEDVKNLSKLLFDFASNAATVINNYGGTNVFAGGDDLLFFAPVAMVKDKMTIFHLINSLDDLFKISVSDKLSLPPDVIKPTLSWGVSISYYKFPLSEAIVSSRKLLFDEAKGFKGKNSVAFKLIKHTGQFFGATFGKDKSDYKVHFKNLLEQAFDPDTDFLSSLQYRILDNLSLLTEIFKEVEYIKKTENFFDNFFDEEIHSDKEYFIHAVRDMLIQTYNDTELPGNYQTMTKEEKDETHKNHVKTAIDKTYSALRFIHFLKSKSDE
jgi:CRISPR-associated protein Cmr2